MKSGDFVRTTLIVEDEKTIRNKLINFIYFYKADLIVLELLFSWYNPSFALQDVKKHRFS